MSILTSFISVLLFYIIPALVGRAVYFAIRKDREVSYPWVSYFVFGALNLFGWALFENYLVLPFLPNFSFIEVYRMTVIALVILSVFCNLIFIRNKKDLVIGKYIQPVLLSIFLSTIVYFIWNISSPYPLNWDFAEHQTLVNTILSGRFSFITSQISDTFIFNGYSSVFHTLLSQAQMLVSPAILDFWKSISLIHLFTVVLVSYLLAYEVTQEETVAVLSAVIGAFVFETITFTSLFFIPQTFTAVIFVFIFIQLMREWKAGRDPSFSFIVMNSVFLILNHYIIGLVGAFIYTCFYIYTRFRDKLLSKIRLPTLIESAIFISVLLIVFSSFLPLSFLNRGEAVFFNYTILEKFSFMQKAYGLIMLIFLPVGITSVIKERKTDEVILLSVAFFTMVLVFLQIPYAFKFYVLGRFFIHVILAIGIFSLLRKIKSILMQDLVILFLIAVMAGIFTANSVYWKNILYYRNLTTQISPNEIEAAQFLKNRYGKSDILLISDPATQNILEALSRVNTQGGAYANEDTRNKLISIPQANGQSEVKDLLFNISDSLSPSSGNRLLALSGRYFIWQKENRKNQMALYFNIWAPGDITFDDKKYISFLGVDKTHFKLVYEDPTVAIFEVNR